MDDLKPHIPARRKPRPGSLPMEDEKSSEPPHPAQSVLPPFLTNDEAKPQPPSRQPTPRSNFDKLKAATKKVEGLRAAVRDDAFDDWVRRFLLPAEKPNEWTQFSDLYESYVKHAGRYGANRGDKALSKLELASETRLGILLRDAGFVKKRRRSGWFYSLKRKQGA